MNNQSTTPLAGLTEGRVLQFAEGKNAEMVGSLGLAHLRRYGNVVVCAREDDVRLAVFAFPRTFVGYQGQDAGIIQLQRGSDHGSRRRLC